GQGAGDSRAPARAVDPPPAGRPAAVRAARPAAARGTEPGAAASQLGRVSCETGDAPALASPTRGSPVDVPAPSPRAPADRPSRARAHPAARTRESELGLYADRR